APDPARGRFRSTPRASTNLRPPDPPLPARYDQSVDSSPLPHRNHSPLDPLSPSAGNDSRSDPEPPPDRRDLGIAPPSPTGRTIHPPVGRAGNGFPGALPDPPWRSSDRGA